MKQSSITKLTSLLICTLITFGCAPSFKKFKQLRPSESDFLQYRVDASGNAVTAAPAGLIDTLIYDRKLNAGITGQVVGNDQFIVVPTFNKRLYFLDPVDGKEITSLVTESSIGAAVALKGELIYFVEEAGGDQLTCFNIVNGKKAWSRKIQDSHGSPVIDETELFIASRTGAVYCLNRWTGDIIWEHDSKRQIYASVSADSQRVIVGTDDGQITALDRTSGKRLWSFQSHGAIFAQAVIAGFVYCGSADGSLYALDLTTGDQVWRFETAAEIHTTPVVVAGRVVFGSDDMMIYCLSADDGSILWSHQSSGIVQSSPIAVGNSFIVANSAGSVYEFDYDGNIRHEFTVRGSIQAGPALIAGRLFVVTTNRRLYSFGPRSSTANTP